MSLAYKNLVAWQRADDLFIEVHRLTHQRFPDDERYELGRQMRRAAFSVPANIVEGNARSTARDTLRFFNIASASLSELTYGLHSAHRLQYIDAVENGSGHEAVRPPSSRDHRDACISGG